MADYMPLNIEAEASDLLGFYQSSPLVSDRVIPLFFSAWDSHTRVAITAAIIKRVVGCSAESVSAALTRMYDDGIISLVPDHSHYTLTRLGHHVKEFALEDHAIEILSAPFSDKSLALLVMEKLAKLSSGRFLELHELSIMLGREVAANIEITIADLSAYGLVRVGQLGEDLRYRLTTLGRTALNLNTAREMRQGDYYRNA